MTRRGSAQAADTVSDCFDLHAELSILRRAAAGLAILTDAPHASGASLIRQLARLSALTCTSLAIATESALARRDASLHQTCSAAAVVVLEVERRLERLPARRASRLAIEMIRRRLYVAIAALSEQLASTDSAGCSATGVPSELERALAMRQLVSDFHGAMLAVARERSSRSWALTVAEGELAILLKAPAFAQGPEAQKKKLSSLRARLARFRMGRRGASSKSSLLGEVFEASSLLTTLSLRSDVKRHDSRVLAELSLLLTRPTLTLAILAGAAEALAELRGMDAELDGWMLELPLQPARVLIQIRRRVIELRARALAS